MYFLAKIVETLLTVYTWLILFRAVLSWVQPYGRVPFAGLLFRLTDPFLGKIRQFLPLTRMAIDLSPVIAILILVLARRLVLAALT